MIKVQICQWGVVRFHPGFFQAGTGEHAFCLVLDVGIVMHEKLLVLNQWTTSLCCSVHNCMNYLYLVIVPKTV